MKINIRTVLLESWDFYKENFRKLAIFAMMGLAYSVLYAFNNYYNAIHGQTPQYWLFLLLIIAIAILFSPRFILAIPIYISRLFAGEEISFLEAYKRTRGKYWAFIKYYLIIMLLFIVPVALLLNVPFFQVYFALAMTIVAIPLFFVVPAISLEGRTKGFLSRSIELVKANIANLLILQVLTNAIFSVLSGFLTEIYRDDASNMLILTCGYASVMFFVSPFANTVVFGI